MNRKNRENRENQPINANSQEYNNSNPNILNNRGNERNEDRPPRRQGNNPNFPNDRSLPNRRFGGGKREFDRQSGSDKTGIKAVDKRDGGGAHNWGSIKQDIEDVNKSTVADWEPEQGTAKDTGKTFGTSDDNGNEQQLVKENNTDQTNNNQQQQEDEEAKEITLDEWKAQRAIRNKPQYNIRKAGEGEDTSQWKKMVALESRKKKVSNYLFIHNLYRCIRYIQI